MLDCCRTGAMVSCNPRSLSSGCGELGAQEEEVIMTSLQQIALIIKKVAHLIICQRLAEDGHGDGITTE